MSPPALPGREAVAVGQFPSWEGLGVGWFAPGSWRALFHFSARIWDPEPCSEIVAGRPYRAIQSAAQTHGRDARATNLQHSLTPPTLFLEDEQLIDFGKLAVRLPRAEPLIFVVEFVAEDDAVFVGGNRHQCFPAIGQERRALHRVL